MMYDLPAALAQNDKANALGITTAQQRVHLTLSAPQIGFGDWVFVARLVEEEAGYVTFCAPGQNLDGWARPDTPHCDYCGELRRRAKEVRAAPDRHRRDHTDPRQLHHRSSSG
ncbi:hypothetical protein [Rhodococcus wratislaviensis]|uniref:hypothetical protein n=1 Tax=Rhodococcus wratislaviensis TaxID=44752 RepID=UPI00364E2E8F